MRNIGGGGRFVPLIGDTQLFSSISCCNTDRYEQTTQNSSNVIFGASQFVSKASDDVCDRHDEVDDSVELKCVNSLRLLSTSRTKCKIRFKFSLDTRSLR